jgi:hypothetical protein
VAVPETVNPRQIYAETCAAIAGRLADHGFRHVRSAQELKRNRGVWLDIVYFQSSSNNDARGLVVLRAGVNERNGRLRRWRREHRASFRNDDWVSGTYLGYLKPGGRYHEWNLHETGQREMAVREVVGLVLEYGLQWFDLLGNIDRLAETVPSDVLGGNVASLVELLLCYERRDDAQSLATRWRGEAPAEAVERLRQALREERPPGRFPTNVSVQLAVVLKANDLV